MSTWCSSVPGFATVALDASVLINFLILNRAACLAAAEHRAWLLASDERRVFRRIACERIGESRILTTPSLLSLAVKKGVISVGELRDANTKLERNRFRMPPGTFKELFSE